MRTLCFSSKLGLGDSLVSAQWMRRLVRDLGYTVRYYVPEHHRGQMLAMTRDLRNLFIEPFQHAPANAVQVPYNGPDRACGADTDDFIAVKVEQFKKTAKDLGFESPVQRREDLLFDCRDLIYAESPELDFYVVNAVPYSWGSRVDLNGMERLIARIKATGKTLACSNPSNVQPADMNVDVFTKAANALKAKTIVCVATGPCWPTFNTVTEQHLQHRLVLCHERVSFGREWPHFTSVDKAESYLEQHRLI